MINLRQQSLVGEILIGGLVVSDSQNVYSASLREEKDAYVLESKDASQIVIIWLYFEEWCIRIDLFF